MKKLFSHPLFYYIFPVLGLGGMGLQFWFFQSAEDSKGLLTGWHPANTLTYVLLVAVSVLAFLSAPYIRTPDLRTPIRSIGAALGSVFCAIAAGVLFYNQNYLVFVLCILSTLSSVYILWSQTSHRKPHYIAYGFFAVCFMFYLISRYRVYSAEPETARYVFKILALICMMLVFYQQAAIRAGTGRFRSYHFFRCVALFLAFTAIPSAGNPMLYLFAAIWLLADPLPRPAPKGGRK